MLGLQYLFNLLKQFKLFNRLKPLSAPFVVQCSRFFM